MQIRNRIIYPSLLVIFMGLHFSSNAIACGGPGSPPCEPDIPITIPNAVTPSPSTFEIPDDLRKNLEDKLKSTNKQIETTEKLIAKFCPSASGPEQCKSFDTELAALQLEKEDILVGLGDESAIHRMNLDNLWSEYIKIGKKFHDTIKEVGSGKSENLDVVLAQLEERLYELNERYGKLLPEMENFGTQKRKLDFHDAGSIIASYRYALVTYSDGSPPGQGLIDRFSNRSYHS